MKDYEDEAFDDLERAQGWRKRQIADAQKPMTEREALKLALEALKQIDEAMPFPVAKLAIMEAEKALAQPDQLYEENERLHVENRRLIERIETIGVPVGVGGFVTTTTQPEPEPVATVESVATVVSESGNQEVTMSWWHEPALPVGTKLYTTPPQRTWVGLTGKEVAAIFTSVHTWHERAEAIEAKLKEKNT